MSSEQEELFGESELEDLDRLLNGLPDRLAEQVKTIGRRHPPDRIRDLIVELCKLRPWKVSEFVSLLQRNLETIRQSYLRPLLEQKRIALKYPESPNSPRQAYTSK